MTNKIYYNSLLDFYGVLLTKKQQEICEEYFRNDATLQEIADDENISKAAVGDMIKRSKEDLDNYENKLHLYSQYIKRNEFYDKIKEIGNDKVNKLIDECIDIEE